MNRFVRNLSMVVVTAALSAPVGFSARAFARQDAEKQEHETKERAEKAEKAAKAEKKLRVYDAKHKQYHDWDANEDQAYRRYMSEKHETYTDYGKLSHEKQTEYWEWRDSNPDRDNADRDRDNHDRDDREKH